MIRRALVLALAAVLLAACGDAAQPLPKPPPSTFDAASLPPVDLPRDDAPHDNLTEWWYVSGHLQTAEGDPFGFEFALFQSVRQGAPPGYAAHFAVTDIGRQRFHFGERTEVADSIEAAPDDSSPRLDLSVDGWTLRDVPGGFSISAGLDTVALQLELMPSKPAAIHNQTGILDFSPFGWSYYYSYTRAEVRGVLLDGGLPRPVTGTAWIDHQWGDFISVASGGWDWYSVHLDDGRDFTASVVRDELGATVLQYGTLVGPAAKRPTCARTTWRFGNQQLDQSAHGRGVSLRLDHLGPRPRSAPTPGPAAAGPGAGHPRQHRRGVLGRRRER